MAEAIRRIAENIGLVIKDWGIRKSKSSYATCNMAASFAKEYDFLYYEIINGEAVLWKANVSGKAIRVIKSGENCIMNVKSTILADKEVRVIETENAFIMRPANEKEIDVWRNKIRTSANSNVTVGQKIRLNREQKDFLGYDCSYTKCTIYCSDKIGYYIEFERHDDIVPDACCHTRGLDGVLKRNGYAEFYLKPGADMFKLPKYFCEKSGVEKNTALPVDIKENKLIFTAKDGVCDVCSRPIKRDKPVHIVKTCKKCDSKLKRAGKVLKESGYQYESLMAKVEKIG